MRENEYRDPKGRVSRPKVGWVLGAANPHQLEDLGSPVNSRSGVWDGIPSEIEIVA